MQGRLKIVRFFVIARDRRTAPPSKAGVGIGSGVGSHGLFYPIPIPREIELRQKKGPTSWGVAQHISKNRPDQQNQLGPASASWFHLATHVSQIHRHILGARPAESGNGTHTSAVSEVTSSNDRPSWRAVQATVLAVRRLKPGGEIIEAAKTARRKIEL